MLRRFWDEQHQKMVVKLIKKKKDKGKLAKVQAITN